MNTQEKAKAAADAADAAWKEAEAVNVKAKAVNVKAKAVKAFYFGKMLARQKAAAKAAENK